MKAFQHNQLTIKRSWLKLVAVIIPVVLLSLGISYVAVDRWYDDNLRPLRSSDNESVVVVIKPGSSLRTIAQQLHDLELIRNGTVFTWYVERQDLRNDLQAGTYRLSPAQSVEDIVRALSEGQVATNLFTILPGKRLDQLREDFSEFGFSDEQIAIALNARYDDHPLFANLPINATIEGYVFPETYQISVDSEPGDILLASFDEFYEQLTPDLLDGLSTQGLTLHEAVTLASIVQQESGSLEDNSTIAQVFLKRLNEGISLGADATFYYAAEVTNQVPSPDLDSPYNTRVYGGLPPGPIGSFNLAALEAVANPSDTDWLFFVAGDDGLTYFSKTEEEHLRLVELHCNQNCQIQER